MSFHSRFSFNRKTWFLLRPNIFNKQGRIQDFKLGDGNGISRIEKGVGVIFQIIRYQIRYISHTQYTCHFFYNVVYLKPPPPPYSIVTKDRIWNDLRGGGGGPLNPPLIKNSRSAAVPITTNSPQLYIEIDCPLNKDNWNLRMDLLWWLNESWSLPSG